MADNAPDMTGWSDKEKQMYEKYGTKPKKSIHMQTLLAGKDRQHFDSADYEMQKEGKGPAAVGRAPNALNPAMRKKVPLPDSVRNAE